MYPTAVQFKKTEVQYCIVYLNYTFSLRDKNPSSRWHSRLSNIAGEKKTTTKNQTQNRPIVCLDIINQQTGYCRTQED